MKKILLLLLFPMLSQAATITISGVNMTITLATGTASGGVSDTITIDSQTAAAAVGTWNMTMGSGADRYILVGCATDIGTVSGITYAGSSLSFIRSDAGPSFTSYLYGLATNSITGSNTIAVTHAGGGGVGNLACGAVTFAGVSQSAAVDVSTGTIIGSIGSGISVTVANNYANEYCSDIRTGGAADTPSGGQTLQWSAHNSSEAFYSFGSTKSVGAAGSQTMSWTAGYVSGNLTAVCLKPGP